MIGYDRKDIRFRRVAYMLDAQVQKKVQQTKSEQKDSMEKKGRFSEA